MFGGWSQWNLGIPNEKIEKIKEKIKFSNKKKNKVEKSIKIVNPRKTTKRKSLLKR